MKRTSKIKNLTELDQKVAELIELQAIIDEYQKKADDIKDEIKACMGDEQEIKTEHYIVRWTKVSSNKFDQSAFKEAHPDMFESFKRISESRRFSISE